jgi:hypothetical protein
VARALAPSPAAVTVASPRWQRPVAIGAGVVAALLGGLAVQQGLAARDAYGAADAMVVGGVIQPPATSADHDAAISRGDRANRNAWVAASGAALSATGAVVLYWLSRDEPPAR